jgi:hypothetical protein
MLNIDVAIFLLAVVLFGAWQIAKLINPKWFYPVDDVDGKKKERVAEIITTVNLTVAVVANIFFMGFGLTTNFFTGLVGIFAVFSAGSFFELFKAYNVVK